MRTLQKYFRVDRSAIGLMRFTFEGYEGIANVTTVDAAAGLIRLNIAPGCEADVEQVLADLQREIHLEAAAGPEKSKEMQNHS